MSARNFDLFGRKTRFGNVTVLKYNAEITQVLLHNNYICRIDNFNRVVRISDCGWATRTTVTAINNTLKQLGISHIRLSIKKGKTMVNGTSKVDLIPCELVNGLELRF